MHRYAHFSIKLLIVGLLIGTVSFGQISDDKVKKLDDFFRTTQQDWNVPGMSVAIVKEGEIVFSKGYGEKSVGEKETPDGNTLYAIASNSKAFTSTLMAMLVQDKKVNWEDKVQTYLPYFEVYDPLISTQVNIRDLLCHRVGLGTFSGDLIWYRSDFSSEEIIRRIKYVPKSFDFRDGFGYSNLMFITAGEIIKEVSGKTWGENLQEHILTPLDMNRTITSISKLESFSNYATPHAFVDNENLVIPWDDWEEIGAMGGIISSVNDISKWMIFNMNHGIVDQDTLLNPYYFNTLWKPYNTFTVNHLSEKHAGQSFSGYGLGWGLSDINGHLKVSHTGGFDGMISAVTMVPDQKIGVVVLTNGMHSPIGAVVNYTLDIMLDIPEKDWSSDLLKRYANYEKSDTRIQDIKDARIDGTSPLFDLNTYTGTFYSDMMGEIKISLSDNKLHIAFSHAPHLNATLNHWHYNVFQLDWENQHTAFSLGTVKFISDNNMHITELTFDVPNHDFFFNEINAKRINN